MYGDGILDINAGKQCGACRQHSFNRIFLVPFLAILRNLSGREIECEKFCQFLETKWTRNHGNTMQETSGQFPIYVVDLVQRPFICLIECRGQIVKCMLNTPQGAVTEVLKLAIRPSKPITETRVRVVKDE